MLYWIYEIWKEAHAAGEGWAHAFRFLNLFGYITPRAGLATLLSFVGTLGYYGAYAVIIYLTVTSHESRAGVFTIGVLTFLAGSFRQSRDLIQRILLSLAQIFEQSLYLDDLFSFLELEPSIRRNPGAKQVPVPIRQGALPGQPLRRGAGQMRRVHAAGRPVPPEQRLLLGQMPGMGREQAMSLVGRLFLPPPCRILEFVLHL